jgi:hypothetical protein
MLLNSSINPAFDRIPMVAQEPRHGRRRRLPVRMIYPGGPKEEYITIFQIAYWILRIVNQKTILKEW